MLKHNDYAKFDAQILAIPQVLRVRHHGPTTVRVLVDPEAPDEELLKVAEAVQAALRMADADTVEAHVHREPGSVPEGYKLVEDEDCDGESSEGPTGVHPGSPATKYWPVWRWESPDDLGNNFTDKAQAIDDAWDDVTEPWRLLVGRIVEHLEILSSDADEDDKRYALLDLFDEEDTRAIVRHAASTNEPETINVRFDEVHYAVGPRNEAQTVLRFTGLPDLVMPDADSRALQRTLNMGGREVACTDPAADADASLAERLDVAAGNVVTMMEFAGGASGLPDLIQTALTHSVAVMSEAAEELRQVGQFAEHLETVQSFNKSIIEHQTTLNEESAKTHAELLKIVAELRERQSSSEAALRLLGFGDEYCITTDPVQFAKGWLDARVAEDRQSAIIMRLLEESRAELQTIAERVGPVIGEAQIATIERKPGETARAVRTLAERAVNLVDRIGERMRMEGIGTDMLDAIRHCARTGDALRPASYPRGGYLFLSPQPGPRARPEDPPVTTGEAQLCAPGHSGGVPATLSVESMLEPWVTLPMRDAHAEAAAQGRWTIVRSP